MQLILPNPTYEASYRHYIHELGDEKRYPFPLGFDHADFQELLAKLERFRNGIDLPDGFVASSTYWLVDGNELVGVSNLRHHLNERIRRAGGHIGLGIRPSMRGKGLGKHLLRATIEQAMAHGIQEVHIHCYKNNLPSARMIIANGGTLESEVVEGAEVVQRYLVNALSC
jgi:predicted acetyltransferase